MHTYNTDQRPIQTLTQRPGPKGTFQGPKRCLKVYRHTTYKPAHIVWGVGFTVVLLIAIALLFAYARTIASWHELAQNQSTHHSSVTAIAASSLEPASDQHISSLFAKHLQIHTSFTLSDKTYARRDTASSAQTLPIVNTLKI